MILSDSDGGKPLLFSSEEEAQKYFASQAGKGMTMSILNAFIRKANDQELAAGVDATA